MTEVKMGNEVGSIVSKMARAVGCSTCGIGIAVDVVGERYGRAPFAWQCGRSTCEASAKGLNAGHVAAVRKVIDGMPRVYPEEVAPAPRYVPDERLPVERDEEAVSP